MNRPADIHIALADDHTIVRRALTAAIHSLGNFRVVIEADNGIQLIRRLDSQASIPDICILDIDMPHLNGYDTAIRLKKKWPGLKILALSMYFSEYSIIRMFRSGARAYVHKDMSKEELGHALTGLYHNGYYYPEVISGRIIPVLTETKEIRNILLTPREEEMLRYFYSDKSYEEIADELYVSIRTVETFRDLLFKKLGARTRVGLVIYAAQAGFF